jgi:2'-5' RNA ligase
MGHNAHHWATFDSHNDDPLQITDNIWSSNMKMRTAIALLVDDDLTNRLASFTLRCRDYGFDLRVLRLPAHVSLKQPFVVNDFERFEEYFEEFAKRIEPQQLIFDGFSFWGNAEQGVVVARVSASARLRQLHAQLNAELRAFGETQAEYDGEAYEFHLAIAIGASRADLVHQLHADCATWKLDEVTESSGLAMFIYEESIHPDPLYGVREYGTYKVLPLRQKRRHP